MDKKDIKKIDSSQLNGQASNQLMSDDEDYDDEDDEGLGDSDRDSEED